MLRVAQTHKQEVEESPEKHIRDTPQFKIKLALLQTLAKLSASHEFRKV
jgi:hypothetical protein